MSAHDINARVRSYIICICAAICLAAVIACTHRDAPADQPICAHVAKRAHVAAQPSVWARLDAQGRRMVAYERIGK
jgi:hypothetical protein